MESWVSRYCQLLIIMNFMQKNMEMSTVCVKSFLLFIDSFRSLGRSIDDTVSESGDFAISIEDDILGDIRTKIEAKIRNYETIIEVLI